MHAYVHALHGNRFKLSHNVAVTLELTLFSKFRSALYNSVSRARELDHRDEYSSIEILIRRTGSLIMEQNVTSYNARTKTSHDHFMTDF